MPRILPVLLVALAGIAAADEFPAPVNTQAEGEHPPSPREMLDLFELPEGFKVTLFAGEPDVQQPIAFDFDDQGRIWVAENYTYSARGKVDQVMRDRVIILHDKDGDGEHDERKVFWDKGRMLTGLTWGYGGLWILNDGTLSFIPDKNGDDVPDSEPVPMLNGWTKNAGHNVVNGLLWGPDGWLYGRHGITDTSYPGTIDTPKAERQPMNCGIWRFHPTKHKFEVVCHGTTNPWGLDYNEVGDMFMTNNVIGHLWHVIPGAHYERMFGQDFNPHLYELMPQIADHYHWDTTGKWSESRDGVADDLGGGHSHCGGMIYYGQNFPKEYHGKIFMCNTHGRCVNVNRLERKGSTYVGKREPNFLKVNTPWFRGVELKYGPRGCVYLTDWSDNGECHDHDGVHRTSGRIYRISYGEPESLQSDSLADMNDVLLADLSSNRNVWVARRSRRILYERAETSGVARAVQTNLRNKLFYHPEGANRLAALQTLDLCGFVPHQADQARTIEPWTEMSRLLKMPDRGVPELAVRIMGRRFAEQSNGNQYCFTSIRALAENSTSPSILREVTAAARNFSPQDRQMIAEILATNIGSHRGAYDSNLEKLTWYLAEPSVANLVSLSGSTLTMSGAPRLVRFAMRKQIASGIKAPMMLSAEDTESRDFELQIAALRGIIEGYEGQVSPKPFDGWSYYYGVFINSENEDVRRLTRDIAAIFGDRDAVKELRKLAANREWYSTPRVRAIKALAGLRDADSLPIFLQLLNDRAVYAEVAKALAAFDDPRIPAELLKRWDGLRHGSQEAAMDTLISRKSYAVELAKAIDAGRVDSAALSAGQVRQLMSFNDPTITKIIEAEWGVINESSEAKEAMIADLKQKLTPDVLAKADLKSGAALFKKSCAACHKLYGEGGKIGPDLTGANRGNMDYLLGNIVDPSGEVPKQFTVSVIALTSGRVITGVVIGETEQVITVQTDKEQMTIAVSDIEERTRTTKSLMPDGLLDPLTKNQRRDLIAFIQHRAGLPRRAIGVGGE